MAEERWRAWTQFAERTFAFWFALCIAFVGNASGQATRFTGSFTPAPGSTNATIQLRETNDSFLSISRGFAATWTYDVTTDGQTITFNTLKVAFAGTLAIPEGNPFVSLDLAFEATNDGTYDVNPIGVALWDVAPYGIFGNVSGTYHSLNFSQPYSAILNPGSDTFETKLDFSQWPQTLNVRRQSESSGSSENFMPLTPPSTVLLEPFLKLDFITIEHPGFVALSAVAALTCPCCECGDFNEDGNIDGGDFLAWQAGYGAPDASPNQGDGNGDHAVNELDLSIWRSHFGESNAGTVVAVPEHGTVVLASCCFVGVSLCTRRTLAGLPNDRLVSAAI